MQNASNQMWGDPWLNKGLRNVTQLISRQAPFFHVDLFNLISTFGFLQTEALPAAKKGRPQAPLLSIWIINLTAN